jgi:hypothetical protein
MALLAPIVAKSAFLDGWKAEGRYEKNIVQSEAKTRFQSWQSDVDSLFNAAGIP